MQDSHRKEDSGSLSPENSNDMLEVEKELAANREQSVPQDPPCDNIDENVLDQELGGVGGRTSSRRDDDSWTTSDAATGFGTYSGIDQDNATISPTVNDRDEYEQRMRASLEERGIEIDQLTAESGGLQASLRHEFDKRVESLRDLQRDAFDRVEQLKRAGGAAWQEASESAERAYSSLKTALEDALSSLRESGTSDQKDEKGSKP